jgi:hypothetical protein
LCCLYVGAVPDFCFSFFLGARRQRRAQGPSKKQQKGPKKSRQKATDRLPFFFFLGAPCVGCGHARCQMAAHVGTHSWLRGLPLRASSL